MTILIAEPSHEPVSEAGAEKGKSQEISEVTYSDPETICIFPILIHLSPEDISDNLISILFVLF